MGHREDLLSAARRLLQEKGYARTTARDLVAESGTNLASIGYHFGSKEALLNEAIGDAFEEWTNEVIGMSVEGNERAPLDAVGASWVELLDNSFERHRPLLVAFVESLAQAERSPELRAQLAGHYQRCRDSLAQVVTDSLGEAEGVDPQVVASFLMAVCDGFILQFLLDPEATPSGEELGQSLGAALAQIGASQTV
jgi:AcrR family transcriptional regulator